MRELPSVIAQLMSVFLTTTSAGRGKSSVIRCAALKESKQEGGLSGDRKDDGYEMSISDMLLI